MPIVPALMCSAALVADAAAMVMIGMGEWSVNTMHGKISGVVMFVFAFSFVALAGYGLFGVLS